MPPSPLSLPNSPVTSCGKIQSSSRLGTVRRSPRMRRPLKIELLSESTLSLGPQSGTIHIPSKRWMNVESWQRIKRARRSSAFLSSFGERSDHLSGHYYVVWVWEGQLSCTAWEKKISSGRFSCPQGAYFSLPRRKKLQNMTALISSVCGLSLGLSCLTLPKLRRDMVSCEDSSQSSNTCLLCSPIDEADLIFFRPVIPTTTFLKSITIWANTHQRVCGKPETAHLLCCVQGQF